MECRRLRTGPSTDRPPCPPGEPRARGEPRQPRSICWLKFQCSAERLGCERLREEYLVCKQARRLGVVARSIDNLFVGPGAAELRSDLPATDAVVQLDIGIKPIKLVEL